MSTQAPVTLMVALLVLGCAGTPPPGAQPGAPLAGVPPPGPAPRPPPGATVVAPPAELGATPPLPPEAVPPRTPPPPARAGAGAWAVSVLGTPFYLAFKAATCVASAAVAAPIAALAGLTPEDAGTIAVLGEGVARNCGPPYVLTPPARVAPPAVG